MEGRRETERYGVKERERDRLSKYSKKISKYSKKIIK